MRKHIALLLSVVMLLCTMLPVAAAPAGSVRFAEDFDTLDAAKLHQNGNILAHGTDIFIEKADDEANKAEIVETDDSHNKALKLSAASITYAKWEGFNVGVNTGAVRIAFDFKIEGDYKTQVTSAINFCYPNYRQMLTVVGKADGGSMIAGVHTYDGDDAARTLDSAFKANDWNSAEFVLYLGTGYADVKINDTQLEKVALGENSAAWEQSINSVPFAPTFSDKSIHTYLDNLVVEDADNASFLESFKDDFENRTNSNMNTKDAKLMRMFKYPSTSNYPASIEQDSERGNVLKLQETGSTDESIWMWRRLQGTADLDWTPDGVYRVSFKFKTSLADYAGTSSKIMALGANGRPLLTVWNDHTYYVLGSDDVAKGGKGTEVTSYIKDNQWNELSFEIDPATKRANVTVNENTLYDVVTGTDKPATEMDTFSMLRPLPHHSGSTSNLTVYYDDFCMEETGEPFTENPNPENLKLTAQSVQNNATNVSTTDAITLTFDQNVNPDTLSEITLKEEGGEANLAKASAAGSVVTVAHDELKTGTKYTLTVPTSVRAATGGAHLEAEVTITFTTAGEAELVRLYEDFTSRTTDQIKNQVRDSQGLGFQMYLFHDSDFEVTTDGEHGNVLRATDRGGDGTTMDKAGVAMWKLHHDYNAEGIWKVSAKIKVDLTGHEGYAANLLGLGGSGFLLGVNGQKYYAGWQTNATDITEYMENGAWNTLEYMLDFNNKKANLTITNGKGTTKLYGLGMGDENSLFTTKTFSEFRFMKPCNSARSTADGPVQPTELTAYFDDLLIEQTNEVTLPTEDEESDLVRFYEDFTNRATETLGTIDDQNAWVDTFGYQAGEYAVETDGDHGNVLKITDTGRGSASGPIGMWKFTQGTKGQDKTIPLSGIWKVSAKIKTDLTGHQGFTSDLLSLGFQGHLLAVNGAKYYAGYQNDGEDLTPYIVNNEWNTLEYMIDFDNQKVNLTITNSKGTTTLYDVNMAKEKADQRLFTQGTFTQARMLFACRSASSVDGVPVPPTAMTAYFDDLLIEQTDEEALPEPPTETLALTAQSVANDATGVSTTDAITLTFNQDVDSATLGGITLTKEGASANLAQASAAGKVVTVAHSALDANAKYTLTVPTSVKAASGAELAAEIKISFTTAASVNPNNKRFFDDFTQRTTANLGSTMGSSPWFFRDAAAEYYGVTTDDDPERGNVLWVKDDGKREAGKFVIWKTANSGGAEPWMKEDVVRVGFKFKTALVMNTDMKTLMMLRWDVSLLSVDGSKYYLGQNDGTDVTKYMNGDNEWNDVLFEIDYANQKVNATINGVTLYNVNLGNQQNNLVAESFNEFRILNHNGNSEVTVYYDDLLVEETDEPFTPEPVYETMTLVSQSLENGTTNVPTSGEITLTFDKDIEPETARFITLSPNPLEPIDVSVAGPVVTVKYSDLPQGRQHSLTVPTTVRGTNYEKLEEPVVVTFTTEGTASLFSYTDNLDDAADLAAAGWTVVKKDANATVEMRDGAISVTNPSYSAASGSTTQVKMNINEVVDDVTGEGPILSGTYRIEFTLNYEEIPMYHNVDMIQIYAGGNGNYGTRVIDLDFFGPTNRPNLKGAYCNTGLVTYVSDDTTYFAQTDKKIKFSFVLNFDTETWRMYYDGIEAAFGEQSFINTLKGKDDVGNNIQLLFSFGDDYGSTPTEHLFTVKLDDFLIREAEPLKIESTNLTAEAVSLSQSPTFTFGTPLVESSLSSFELYETANPDVKISNTPELGADGKTVTLRLMESLKNATTYTIKLPRTITNTDLASAGEQSIQFTTEAVVSAETPAVQVNGAAASTAKAGDTVKATAHVTGNGSAQKEALLIICVYDENGTMRSSVCSKAAISGTAGSDLSAEIKVPEGVENGCVKVFTWDSFANMNSVSDATEIPVE